MEYEEGRSKTTINLSPSIMKKVDQYASELGINRSATISVLINQAFDYQEQVKQVAEFNQNFKKYQGDMKKALEAMNIETE